MARARLSASSTLRGRRRLAPRNAMPRFARAAPMLDPRNPKPKASYRPALCPAGPG